MHTETAENTWNDFQQSWAVNEISPKCYDYYRFSATIEHNLHYSQHPQLRGFVGTMFYYPHATIGA